jgi:hypothetical protein
MGYAEGLGVGAHVGQQVWNNIDPIQRQAAIEQVQAQRQQNALGALNLQKQQMAYQDLLGARSAAQNAQGTPAQTTTTVQPGQTQPPALSDAFGVQTALGANPATGSSPQSDVQGLQANVDKYPQLANQLGATQRLQEMKAEAPPVDQNAPVDASGFPAPATETSPIVQAYKEGRVQSTTTPAMPPDRIKAQIDYYHSVGNMDAANALKQQVFAESKNIVDATGNMADGLKLMNSAFGTNYSYTKLPSLDLLKDGDGNIVSAINKNGVEIDIAKGMSMSQAITNNSTPINMGSGPVGKQISQFMADNPDFSYQDLASFIGKNGISVTSKGIPQLLESARKSDEDSKREERFNASQERIAKNTERMQANSDRMYALALERLKNSNGSQEDVNSMATAILNGQMAPSDLPKRGGVYNRIVGEVLRQNPDFDVMKANSTAAMMKNPVIMQKGATLSVVPEILGKTVEAGIKMNFPDAKFAGIAQKWTQGQLNDPNLAKYMALRNDSLMTIAGVMRGNGMTDLAHQVEMEAQHPTQSPRALKGWLEGQLTSFDPRIRSMNDLVGGRLKPTKAVVNGQTYTPNGPELPQGAVKGKFHGTDAYTVNGVVYDMAGKRLN